MREEIERYTCVPSKALERLLKLLDEVEAGRFRSGTIKLVIGRGMVHKINREEFSEEFGREDIDK